MEMWGPALAFTVLLLQGRHSQASLSSPDCFHSDEPVVRPSGTSFCLRPPNTQTKVNSAEWKVQLRSKPQNCVILTWKNDSGLNDTNWKPSYNFNNRLDFTREDFSLLLKAPQQDDSGNYSLEVTSEEGIVWIYQFHVSVFDPVGKPRLQLLGPVEALGRRKCQVTLNCSVSGEDVRFAWYRGSERLLSSAPRLEDQIDAAASGSYKYTCSVSNPVSRANETLQLSQGCQGAHPKFGLLLMVIVILIISLPLGTLAYLCVWRRKRKPPQPSPEGFLTVYEDVNNWPLRSSQMQDSPGKGNTVYSMILPQSSASTSQETASTLYAVVLSSGKSGSKKRSPSPSFASTIYEEVGKIQPKAQHPA